MEVLRSILSRDGNIAFHLARDGNIAFHFGTRWEYCIPFWHAMGILRSILARDGIIMFRERLLLNPLSPGTTTSATTLSNNARRTEFGTNHFAWNKFVEGKGEEEGNKTAIVQASKSVPAKTTYKCATTGQNHKHYRDTIYTTLTL
jgi:hypothetical protein